MPKVTDYKHGGYKIDVCYDVREDKFYIGLPAELCGYGVNGRLWGPTRKAVTDEFDKVADKFVKEKVGREKYIVVEMEAVRNSTGFFCDNDISRAGGQAGFLNLQWAVVDKLMINGEVRFVYVDKNRVGFRENRIWEDEDKVFIPWTEGREAFLERATTAVRELSKNIHDFVSSEDLGARIDSAKVPLLLEPMKRTPQEK